MSKSDLNVVEAAVAGMVSDKLQEEIVDRSNLHGRISNAAERRFIAREFGFSDEAREAHKEVMQLSSTAITLPKSHVERLTQEQVKDAVESGEHTGKWAVQTIRTQNTAGNDR